MKMMHEDNEEDEDADAGDWPRCPVRRLLPIFVVHLPQRWRHPLTPSPPPHQHAGWTSDQDRSWNAGLPGTALLVHSAVYFDFSDIQKYIFNFTRVWAISHILSLNTYKKEPFVLLGTSPPKVIWKQRIVHAQVRNPQIHPQNCPSPSTINYYPRVIHSSLDRPHSPSQTA